jgi:MFS family permease
VAIAAGAALALADGSIVVLALPELLSALDTGVEGVAAVIGVYTAVLALALLPAEALRRRLGPVRLGAMGLTAFGLASLICGLAGSLPLMLTMRGLQALGGAATLVAAFALLDAGTGRGGGGRLWMLAAIGGAAAGPALGGALTQAFSWSAIFFAQVPVALAGALACLTGAR